VKKKKFIGTPKKESGEVRIELGGEDFTRTAPSHSKADEKGPSTGEEREGKRGYRVEPARHQGGSRDISSQSKAPKKGGVICANSSGKGGRKNYERMHDRRKKKPGKTTGSLILWGSPHGEKASWGEVQNVKRRVDLSP